MPDLFTDTSGWGNLVDAGEPHHELAAKVYRLARQQKRKVVTTNYVVAELVALMISPLRIPRPKLISFVLKMKASPYVEIIHVDPTLDGQAWDFLQSHPDKDWSLVDCASFVVMQQRGIRDALTSDHHFEQAGFARLLK